MQKSRSKHRDGFKAHLAVEPETGIITGVDLIPANAATGLVASRCSSTKSRGRRLGDSANSSGQTRADLAEAGHTAVIMP